MEESVNSVGIDIGTSTTQVVFSRLVMKQEQGFGRAPKIKIVDKQVISRGKIYETPLKADGGIDAEGIRGILKKEFERVGCGPEEISIGAVIITGESSKKKNARYLVQELTEMSGDFVVAEAGPDLEAVLAGKGAGADLISLQEGKITANLDIGGGTTNICVFRNGEPVDTACYDIGGKMIKTRDGKVTGRSEAGKRVCEAFGIGLEPGQRANPVQAERFCGRLAELLAAAVGVEEGGEEIQRLLKKLITSRELSGTWQPELLTFSGGVADCLESETSFAYGDIGDILGRQIGKNPELMKRFKIRARETIRATVIGAGNHSMEISGNTVDWEGRELPLKNVPVLRLHLEKEEDLDKMVVSSNL